MGGGAAPRTIFMGTPSFAATVLRGLLTAERVAQIEAVVTQPDRPVGRSQEVIPPPVKAEARSAGLPVLQPASPRRPAVLAALRRLAPELIVVAAYGRILPAPLLDLPRLGCINVHASLLPRHRGASPVQGAILAGDHETGVSIMLMDEGMDTGPVLARRAEPIRPDDTAGMLTERLASLGAELLVETIPAWVDGRVVPEPQDDRKTTYTRPLRKSDGLVDWSRPAAFLERQVRAMDPWPGASTTFRGRQLKLLQAAVATVGAPQQGGPPGLVVGHDGGAAVVTGEGLLVLRRVQLEGRQPLDVASFLRGQRECVGSVLGADVRPPAR